MTANKYIKLTGACRAGTENFLNKHDFDFKTKIKIKDLLPLLEESNEWGLSRIKELLQKIN